MKINFLIMTWRLIHAGRDFLNIFFRHKYTGISCLLDEKKNTQKQVLSNYQDFPSLLCISQIQVATGLFEVILSMAREGKNQCGHLLKTCCSSEALPESAF